MARIAGVEIPPGKKIEISLTYIYGLGRSSAARILEMAKVDPNKRTRELSEAEIANLRNIIEKEYKVEGDLRQETSVNIKRLIDIKSYRGMRHLRNLPVRGQRTRTNARTRKGRKKTVGVIRQAKEKVREEGSNK